MASGTQHDRATILLSIAMGTATLPVNPSSAIPLALGCLANLYLSPDLDQANTGYKCKAWHRWRRLFPPVAWYWKLYAKAIPHHRHWSSHGPIIGTLGRLLPALVVWAYFNFEMVWPLLWQLLRTQDISLVFLAFPAWVVWGFVGLVAADTLHLVMDWLWSEFR
ncbi:MAG: DUF2227 family putative metal-binding protein [Cyanobacteria bacterium P01_D01_bin.36]